MFSGLEEAQVGLKFKPSRDDQGQTTKYSSQRADNKVNSPRADNKAQLTRDRQQITAHQGQTTKYGSPRAKRLGLSHVTIHQHQQEHQGYSNRFCALHSYVGTIFSHNTNSIHTPEMEINPPDMNVWLPMRQGNKKLSHKEPSHTM